MGKYEDLEKLQALKNNGTITDAEFEVEKNKVLNEEKQGLNKKKKQLTWWQIILTIVVIVGIALAIGNWVTERETKVTDKDLKDVYRIYEVK